MSDFPNFGILDPLAMGVVSVHSTAIGLLAQNSPTARAWGAANLARFFPLRLPVPVTVYKMATGFGVGATGNIDMGIYDRYGNKLVSTGATAVVASSEVVVDVTDTQIGPGLYYFGFACDSTAAGPMATSIAAEHARLLGALEMNTAYPLPSTATFASNTNIATPIMCAHIRTGF